MAGQLTEERNTLPKNSSSFWLNLASALDISNSQHQEFIKHHFISWNKLDILFDVNTTKSTNSHEQLFPRVTLKVCLPLDYTKLTLPQIKLLMQASSNVTLSLGMSLCVIDNKHLVFVDLQDRLKQQESVEGLAQLTFTICSICLQILQAIRLSNH